MDEKRFEELLLRWEEEGLSEEESAEIAEHLESHSEARESFVAHFQISQGIAGFMTDLDAGERTGPARRPREAARRSAFRAGWGWAAAAACLAAVVLWRVLTPGPSGQAHPLAVFLEVTPGAVVVRDDRQVVCVKGFDAYADDGIITKAGQRVSFQYLEEHTLVQVGENTKVTIEGIENGKRMNLLQGRVSLAAAPQPKGLPLVIETPQALCRVRGTVFSVTAGAEQTMLDVDDGLVEIERKSDGQKLDVAAGHYAVAGSGIELAALPVIPVHGWATFAPAETLFEDDFEKDLSRWQITGDPDGTMVRIERMRRDGKTSAVAVIDSVPLEDREQTVGMKTSVPFSEECLGLVLEYDTCVKALSSDGEKIPKERLGKWEHFAKQNLFLRDKDTGRIRGLEIREYRGNEMVRQERGELHPDFPRKLSISFSTSRGGVQMVDNVRMRRLVRSEKKDVTAAGRPFVAMRYREGRAILEDDFSGRTANWTVPMRNYEGETLFEDEKQAATHVSMTEVSRAGKKTGVLVVDSRDLTDRWMHVRTKNPLNVRAYVMECDAMVREAYPGETQSDMGVLSTVFIKSSERRIQSNPKIKVSRIGQWVTYRREQVAVPVGDGKLEIHSRFFWGGKLYLWETRQCRADAPWFVDLCVMNGKVLVDRVTIRELVPVREEER